MKAVIKDAALARSINNGGRYGIETGTLRGVFAAPDFIRNIGDRIQSGNAIFEPSTETRRGVPAEKIEPKRGAAFGFESKRCRGGR